MAKKKFKLKDFLYRVRMLTLIADVFIDGEEVKNYPVGTVKLRGVHDPVYTKRSMSLLDDYREEITAESTPAQVRDAADRITVNSVVIALEDWDEDLFDMPFSQENAYEIFSDAKHAIFFNQIAHYIKERTHFLPLASQPQGNG